MAVRILQGDCRSILPTLPADSVHCCVTSPPYWGLRDYGVAGQLGLEPTFTEFIDKMVEVFREVRRVLRPDGTLWLNLGDSYAGSNMTGGNASINASGGADGFKMKRQFDRKLELAGLKPKDLCGIPWRVAFALQADGWWLRQDIIWSKPNPMPESVTDRCTKAHEYLFLLTKQPRYFYDAEAIREPISESTLDRWSGIPDRKRPNGLPTQAFIPGEQSCGVNPSGRNKRSVWDIATSPFPQAHFATFPPALVEPCIKAGTSEKGCCGKCGAPWEREIAIDGYTESTSGNHAPCPNKGHLEEHQDRELVAGLTARGFVPNRHKITRHLGWHPTCTCQAAVIPCTVLDPFGGAGTTGLVADRLQRHAILIELNPAYAEMARKRIFSDAPLFAEAAE